MLKLGLDLDGTITAYPEYFRWLADCTHEIGGPVYVVTYRTPETKQLTRELLASLGVAVDVIVLCGGYGLPPGKAKRKVIGKEGIQIFYADDPAVIAALPKGVAGFLVDGGANYQ